jgi:hypothetical protein
MRTIILCVALSFSRGFAQRTEKSVKIRTRVTETDHYFKRQSGFLVMLQTRDFRPLSNVILNAGTHHQLR